MRSPSHISSPPLIIITHPFPPPPLFFPLSLSEVSGDSGPCYLAPPFLHGGGEEGRGRKREAAAHYHHVPRGPLACLPLLLLSTAVTQYQTLTSWDLNPAGEPREEPLCVRAPRLSRCLFIKRTKPTLTPSTAAKPLCLSMAVAARAQALTLPLVLALLSLAPAPILGGCPLACRCSFAILQCLEPDGITSIPVLAPQESENVTEM